MSPIITLSLFKRARFSATSIMSFLVGTALIISMVNIPFFFLTVFNQSTAASGLALLRLTALIPIGALIGGRLCSRYHLPLDCHCGFTANGARFLVDAQLDHAD